MYLLFLILLATATLTNGKPTLLATVGGYSSSVLDIVAIDPTKGNVTILYQLPQLPSLSGVFVCMKMDSKRNLIHVLVDVDIPSGGARSVIYELSLVDGHLIKTLNITLNKFGTWEGFAQWDYDSDTSTLYGLCLNQSDAFNWNYTWCYVKFDETNSGLTQHGFYVSDADDPPVVGPCSRVSMNRNTFFTGEYWYAVGTDLFVRHITSPTGEPGEMLWTVEDTTKYINPPKFAALVTGKTNEYAIVVRPPLSSDANESMAVVKLKPGGYEDVIAKLPGNLIPMGPGAVLWGYDPSDEVLYLLMATNLYLMCDTLVRVNLTQPTNSGSSSFHTIPVSLDSLFDPQAYFVNEIHLVDWPLTTLGP